MQKYFKRAQDNIIKIENQERKFIKNYRKINVDLEDLKTPNKRNDDDTDTVYTENSVEHMLDSISTTSDVEAIEVQIDDAAQSKV